MTQAIGSIDPVYGFTSRFAPFVIRDDDDASDDELLYSENWLGRRDRVILAFRDNRLEMLYFNDLLAEIVNSLAATGYYTLMRLRELANDIRTTPWSTLEPLINELRDMGDEDLVEKALNAFRSEPPKHNLPGPAEHKAASKAATLQALAERGTGPEAETAARLAEKIVAKHNVIPKKSKWSLDLEEVSEDVPQFVRSVTPVDILIQKLDGALKRLRPLAERIQEFRRHGRDDLEMRSRTLIDMLQDPHGLAHRLMPEIVYRRS